MLESLLFSCTIFINSDNIPLFYICISYEWSEASRQSIYFDIVIASTTYAVDTQHRNIRYAKSDYILDINLFPGVWIIPFCWLQFSNKITLLTDLVFQILFSLFIKPWRFIFRKKTDAFCPIFRSFMAKIYFIAASIVYIIYKSHLNLSLFLNLRIYSVLSCMYSDVCIWKHDNTLYLMI